MPSFPLLFDLGGAAKPTTRAIADTVKRGGTAALTEAEARADQARYQEVTCRSALNRVEGMPFNWTLNPYRGCTHGCHYCFARRYHVQFEMNADDEFASMILVKHNIVDVLRRELDRPGWAREQVAVGTATDPYQPIEGHYKLTRHAIEALARGRTPIGLVTKGPMVVRDIDVLQEHSRAAALHDLHERADGGRGCVAHARARHGAPASTSARGAQLVDAGINAGVLMAPIVPGFSSSRSKLERTVKAIADHGARFVGCNVMYLQDGTRTHFMKFIEREFPAMTPRFERLYAKKYPPDAYRKEVQGMVKVLQARYGMDKRERAHEPEAPASDEPEQVGFAF